ncbi:MAG: methionine adenosyltransferase domain-containing protein [Candidatus Saccharibacteria bacterium]|nr:methionine adenosyltransferase domain-containing protein [Candidatus Saccharibacteria bacterium]
MKQFLSSSDGSIQTKIVTRTAEFVSPKHPDKICDQISDAILDAYLAKDSRARVAVDVMGGHGKLYIMGEVTSTANIDIEQIAYKYVGDEMTIGINIVKQSAEIARGVDIGGAGDQGIMVGYACAENEEYLPQEYVLARDLCKYIYDKHQFDGKTQVTVELTYINGRYISTKIKHIVISWQNVPAEELKNILNKWLTQLDKDVELADDYSLSINPAGDWAIGGFDADSGLTGRKIVVDNYGPRVPVGGGAFSGKDPSKVDRSAAYMARKIAVDYLEKHHASEVTVNISYAIGRAEPVDATAYIDGHRCSIVGYDLSPQGIIQELGLLQPQYAERAKWGQQRG